MDGALTELFLGVTAAAYLPLAAIAVVEKLVRRDRPAAHRAPHHSGST